MAFTKTKPKQTKPNMVRCVKPFMQRYCQLNSLSLHLPLMKRYCDWIFCHFICLSCRGIVYWIVCHFICLSCRGIIHWIVCHFICLSCRGIVLWIVCHFICLSCRGIVHWIVCHFIWLSCRGIVLWIVCHFICILNSLSFHLPFMQRYCTLNGLWLEWASLKRDSDWLSRALEQDGVITETQVGMWKKMIWYSFISQNNTTIPIISVDLLFCQRIFDWQKCSQNWIKLLGKMMNIC